MTRYQAEFETRRKKRTEGWADFGEDLRSLADRAFPDLQPEARECLALQSYLKQLDQPQVAFSVKQTRPRTLDEAVAATYVGDFFFFFLNIIKILCNTGL